MLFELSGLGFVFIFPTPATHTMTNRQYVFVPETQSSFDVATQVDGLMLLELEVEETLKMTSVQFPLHFTDNKRRQLFLQIQMY